MLLAVGCAVPKKVVWSKMEEVNSEAERCATFCAATRPSPDSASKVPLACAVVSWLKAALRIAPPTAPVAETDAAERPCATASWFAVPAAATKALVLRLSDRKTSFGS